MTEFPLHAWQPWRFLHSPVGWWTSVKALLIANDPLALAIGEIVLSDTDTNREALEKIGGENYIRAKLAGQNKAAKDSAGPFRCKKSVLALILYHLDQVLDEQASQSAQSRWEALQGMVSYPRAWTSFYHLTATDAVQAGGTFYHQ